VLHGHERCWTCDTCGEPIRRPRDGWVSWAEQGGVIDQFQIVHHASASPLASMTGCYAPDELGSMHLSSALGSRGLAELLRLLDGGAVAPHAFAKLVRRLQQPKPRRVPPRETAPSLVIVNAGEP
jgi:hypothetical protein